ncbi:MAG: pyridoxal-phosphate dependent enzyme [Gemmatimonadota bacterium]|jgi:cystathionine beta-synthase
MSHARPHTEPYDSVLDLIGWTPMIRLSRVTDGIRTPVFAKAEFMSPGGSVKDRIGLAMIRAFEESGELEPGGVIVEATSGNTGFALAMAATVRGYRCVFTMPDKMSQEKVKLLRALGAEVVITPTAVPPDHPESYTEKAKAIAAGTPGAILANQFYNPSNPDAHYRTTGPEVWEQTGGQVSHFLAGAGTGGTISGTARYLKERNEAIRIVGVDPVGSILAHYHAEGELIEGQPYKVEGLGSDKIPGNLHMDLIDRWITVSDGQAFRMARRLSREEGLFVGGSSGLLVHAALEVAREVDDPEACVVTILCDWGEHYLTKLYDDDWMRENGFLERTRRRTVDDLVATKEDDAPALLTVEPSTSIRMALSTITTHDVSQLPVVRDGECLGSVAEGDLMSRVIEDPALLDEPVESVMDAPFPVVDGHAAADEVAHMLTRSNAACLVRRAGALSGIVTRYDVVRTLTGAVR